MGISIDAAAAYERLQQKTAVFVDTRFSLQEPQAGRAAYEQDHISGAFYLDLENDLSSEIRADRRGGRHPLPDPGVLAYKLEGIGIGTDTAVIAYDAQGGAFAARLLWLLDWIGHKGERYILDGGYDEWKRHELPVTAVVPEAIRASFQLAVNADLVVDADEVRRVIGLGCAADSEVAGQSILIDSREPARYLGEIEPIDAAAGHIPGAINRFWKEGLNEQGLWKDAASQRERFGDLPLDAELIVYCGSGVTATPNILALREAGYTKVKLYSGSWSDWSSDPENPVAKGRE